MGKKRRISDTIAGLQSTSAEEKAERRAAAREIELRSAKSTIRQLAKRVDDLSDALDSFAAIRESERISKRPVRRLQKSDEHHAIAIVTWSDWHVAERVDKNKTHGRNQFNPEVCEARVSALADNSLRMLDVVRSHVRIDEVVLLLLGDFVTGYLHPELAETNCMGPMEEAFFAQQQLSSALQTFLGSCKAKRVRIVCHRGNHGRTTRKMQFKNDYETSVESFIYWNLRDQFAGDEVEWVIPKSDVAYTELQPGYLLRSIHGHQIRYGGGVGGISIPLNKWVYRQNATTPAVLTKLGHFHTFDPARTYGINGSIKGWDEFALSLGFAYEPPSQSIEVFDCRRKIVTARHPIFCE